MMTEKRTTSRILFTIFLVLPLCNGVDKIPTRFRIEYVPIFIREFVSDNYRGANDFYFSRRSKNERLSLCEAAKNHAALQFSDPERMPCEFEVMKRARTEAMKCKSIPTAYLYYDPTKDEVVIMLEMNRRLKDDHVFREELVESATPCSETLKRNSKYFDYSPEQFDQVVKSECYGVSYLDELRSTELEFLCISAKKRVPDVPYVFVNNEIERPQKYEIVYKDRTEERVVLKCPTEPPALVMFCNLLENEDVLVLLEKNDSVEQEPIVEAKN